ncbi:MAG TPA: DUF6174 domain-containing protein [Bacteroidota bacterium]|nr:DUF6174 domain-containing protein [Bacteroidota bacterium]
MTVVTRCLLATALVVAMLLGVSACEEDSSSLHPSELTLARSRWSSSGMRSYTMVQRRICYCMLGGRDVEITVVDGMPRRGVLRDTGDSLTTEQLSWYRTVDELFAFIDSLRAHEPAEWSAEYDSRLGFPLRVSVDYSRALADDEIEFHTSDVRH